jgi:hypothetical protein
VTGFSGDRDGRLPEYAEEIAKSVPPVLFQLPLVEKP